MSAPSNNNKNVASPRTLRVVSDRHPRLPVTPQRLSVHKQIRAVSSPMTPTNISTISSPFTPITNVYSSSANTPNSSSSSCTKVEISPENQRLKSKSIADATNNWRTRAKENGIKVSKESNNSDQTSPNELLPSSFLTTHRRSRQSLFQSKSNDGTAFISPRAARLSDHSRLSSGGLNPSSLSNTLLATPEPPKSLSGAFGLYTPSPQTSSAIIQSLRQRGCQTDPARTRRRETFGGDSSINSDTLFDIDEDASMSSSPRNYSPYSRGYGSPLALEPVRSANTGGRSVSAPFTAFNFSMCESDEDELDHANTSLCMSPHSRAAKLRAVRSISAFPTSSKAKQSTSVPKAPATPEAPKTENEQTVENCSVCSVLSTTTSLSALQPCEHRICSSCLTGALNIIGEKDMTCAVCEEPVQDFKLLTPLKDFVVEEGVDVESKEDVMKLLPSAFSAISPRNSDKASTASPVSEVSRTQDKSASNGELAVLRIDNVPWDVTPKDLRSFFPQYKVVRAYVLLDPKGKTLSHAFVEVAAADAPGALRSAQNKPLGRDKRRRAVTVTMSNQGELMRALFPSWLGSFEGSRPSLSGLDQNNVAIALATGVLTTTELESLIILMENPKSHFLKSPCLPFYSLISILSKFPADRDSRVFWSSSLRDVMFEITVAAAGILVHRMTTEYADEELLQLFMQAALDCQAFTDTQRQKIFDVANTAPQSTRLDLSGLRSPVQAESSIDESATSEEVHTPDDSVLSMSPNGRSRYPAQLSAIASRMRPSLRQTGGGAPRVAMSPMMMTSPLAPRLSSPHINIPNMLLGGVPMSPNATMNMAALYAMQMQNPHTPYQSLAHEFGVEPDLVAALAQRLAMAGVGPMNGQGAANGMGMYGMM